MYSVSIFCLVAFSPMIRSMYLLNLLNLCFKINKYDFNLSFVLRWKFTRWPSQPVYIKSSDRKIRRRLLKIEEKGNKITIK